MSIPAAGEIGSDAAQSAAFFGHPRGLATLFFTEMWERFSYYGMRALLILFMTAGAQQGGLGFGVAKAGAIYGLYTASVYLLSLPGGWIADRILGQRRAVLYGGLVIALGHFSMAFPSLGTFYSGLILIVLGTGLLKPNISTMVGQLYSKEDGRRDAGFSLFYMGINLGAFLSPLICGYVGQRINWHWGFALGGIGMTAGLIQYLLGTRHLGAAGVRRAPAAPKAGRQLAAGAVVIAVLAAVLAALDVTAEQLSGGAGVFLTLLVAAVFGWLIRSPQWTAAERKRLWALLLLFLGAVIFFASSEQAGSTLNLFAARSTDNSLFGISFPSSWFQSVNSIFVITLAPLLAWIWIRLGHKAPSKDPSYPAKFALGLAIAAASFLLMSAAASRAAGGRVSPMWLIAAYFLTTIGELCLSPVGLSAFSKLAPPQVSSLMMGVFFLSISTGDYLAGRAASVYESFSLPTLFFAVGVVAAAAAMVLAVLVRPIRRLMGE